MYALGGKVHILVFHGRTAKKTRGLCGSIIYERVVCRIVYWRVDASRTLAVDRIEAYGVVDSLIVMVDSELQRVHLGCVNTKNLR